MFAVHSLHHNRYHHFISQFAYMIYSRLGLILLVGYYVLTRSQFWYMSTVEMCVSSTAVKKHCCNISKQMVTATLQITGVKISQTSTMSNQNNVHFWTQSN